MATTGKTTGPTATAPAAAEQPWLTPQRIRILGIAGAVVLVAGLIIWFMITAGHRKEAYAANALEQARGAAEQGNPGAAVQQLTEVATRYAGTSAAYEAHVEIAKARLILGQNELALATLTDFLKTNPPPIYAAAANSLMGTAYENTAKYPEAEAAYKKASSLASMDYLKANDLLDAARAARLAGKPDDAKALYNEIITTYAKTGAVTEAKVRLAELTGGVS